MLIMRGQSILRKREEEAEGGREGGKSECSVGKQAGEGQWRA